MTKVQNFFAETIEVRSYSGRGMYGKTCLAITGSPRECQRAIASVVDVLIDEIVDASADVTDDTVSDTIKEMAETTLTTNRKLIEQLIVAQRSDSMGLSSVVYWPDMAYDDSDEPSYRNDADDKDDE